MFTKVKSFDSYIFLVTSLLFLSPHQIECSNSELNGSSFCKSHENGILYSDKNNCKNFYYCYNGNALPMNCSPNMGFSSSKGGCVSLDESDCPGVEKKPSGTCVGNEERPKNQKACKGQPFGELVPYPGNCAKFLVCNCEYPTVKDCAAGTWFDNELKLCNFPQSVKCSDNGGETTPFTTWRTTWDPTWKTTWYTTGNPTWKTTWDTTPNPTWKTTWDTTRNPTWQTTWYTTPNPTWITTWYTSPNPTTWETTRYTTKTTTTETPTSTVTQPEFTTSMPTDSTSRCQEIEGVSNSICLNEIHNSFMQYPDDCNAYIKCFDECPILMYCPKGKVFNPSLKICDNQGAENCKQKN